jgi:SSS family solute:Na+ symporter
MIIALIGVFLFFFGLFYQLKGDLWTYLGVTGTIYLSSMSVLLIACCYWRRANNWGATAAIISGAFFPTMFLIVEQKSPLLKELLGGDKSAYYTGIAAYVIAALAMIVGSLLKPGQGSIELRTSRKEQAL